jgi:hypothetical protein
MMTYTIARVRYEFWECIFSHREQATSGIAGRARARLCQLTFPKISVTQLRLSQEHSRFSEHARLPVQGSPGKSRPGQTHQNGLPVVATLIIRPTWLATTHEE